MSLQNQLDPSYHTDQFLRDILLTAVDIPHIQASLRDRLPRASQQAIIRMAIKLSESNKSAESSMVYEAKEDDEANYSLEKVLAVRRGSHSRPLTNPRARPQNTEAGASTHIV